MSCSKEISVKNENVHIAELYYCTNPAVSSPEVNLHQQVSRTMAERTLKERGTDDDGQYTKRKTFSNESQSESARNIPDIL